MGEEIFKTHYDRLKRHYVSNLNGYDQVSLLDLAHALRIFTEIPNWIDERYEPTLFVPNFSVGMKRMMRGAEFSYCYLPPDGVTVKAKVGWNGLFEFQGPASDPFSMGGGVKLEADQRLSIREFFLIYRELSASEVKFLDTYSKTVICSKTGLKGYLDSIAIRFKFNDESPQFISRTELIRRVANEHDASHPSFADKTDSFINTFSAPVYRLMKYTCADLPLPFFVLLHIAKSILVSLEDKMK